MAAGAISGANCGSSARKSAAESGVANQRAGGKSADEGGDIASRKQHNARLCAAISSASPRIARKSRCGAAAGNDSSVAAKWRGKQRVFR